MTRCPEWLTHDPHVWNYNGSPVRCDGVAQPAPTDSYRDGVTYDDDLDRERLNLQHERVAAALADQNWHTLHWLSVKLDVPEASVSARIRDLRKPRFGQHEIERRRVVGGNGQHEYRMTGERAPAVEQPPKPPLFEPTDACGLRYLADEIGKWGAPEWVERYSTLLNRVAGVMESLDVS